MAKTDEIAQRRIEHALANGATELNLTGLRLTRIPHEVRQMEQLTILYLGQNDLTELPHWFADLTQLTHLYLHDNRLTELPRSLADFTQLNDLSISDNDLTELPDWLRDLPHLTRLNVGGEQLTRLSDQLGNLTQIAKLTIYSSQLTELPDSLAGLTQLTNLSVSFNQLAELPEWLASFTQLTELDVSSNPLTELPEWLGNLNNLTEISVNHSRLVNLPTWLESLPHLTALHIAGNRLAELPEWLGNLTKLTQLSARGNQLTEVPSWLENLPHLTTLYIGRNRLTELPEWLGNLTELTQLDVSESNLTELPDWLGNLTKLVYLSADENQLTELPDYLSKLTRLSYLSAESNQLPELPDSLANLTQLTTLRVSDNRLTVLPSWLGNLNKLTGLSATRNRLTDLPNSLTNLTQVTNLHLQDNRLTALPEWLLDLPELLYLNVDNNPFSSPPPEITSSGSASLLEFLAARREGATKQWVSKMLVVGEGGVGKTSTIKSLTDQQFDRNEESTHGLRIYDLELDYPGEPDTSMKLSTWDFGGQQIYHATHQFFLTDRSLFLLLWNSRLGWEQGRMRYWLDIIAARAPESPVLLVATNAPCGGRPVDLPLDDLCREYPQIVTNIAVDNETQDGLDSLRSAIAQVAATLPLMGTEWPTRWLAAADAVRKYPAKHVTPSVMWREMTAAGLSDREHQRYVATALHQLGDILYYQDDPELAETVILKPEWVNEYISLVLDSPEVERRYGLLTRDHVNTLWADLDRGMRDHFLGMMEKYDLSYHLGGGSPTDLCLVVERLTWNAPPYQEAWDQSSPDTVNHEIRVHYQLNTTPPGIPTWFIARSHRFTTGTHWRTGALLADTDGRHRALVRTDNHRNVIELAVRGPSPASFFAVLNDGINVTLNRYPGLSVTRSVPCPCGGADSEPCTELFDHDDLQKRLNRTPPRHFIECRKSCEDVYVPLLLLGLAPSERDELRTSFQRLSKTITAQHDDLAERFDDLSADMQRQFLKVQQQVKAGLETKCPSVFALTATKHSAIKGTKYSLHLYCEEPGAWHPLPVETSVYQITESAAWLQRFGPHLRTLVDVLKHAAPLAGPVLGMTVGQISDRISADIDAMNALIDQIPEGFALGSSFGMREGLSPDPAAHGSTEADYRSLESLMTKLDPDRKWGGLSRVATPEGLTLYLCPTHSAPYERTPRAPGPA